MYSDSLWVGRFEVRIPVGEGYFLFPTPVQTGPEVHTTPFAKGIGTIPLGTKANGWSYTSIPIMCFHGMLREDLYLTVNKLHDKTPLYALLCTSGIVTGYGLDAPGIESRCGEIFRTRPDWPCGPPSLLQNG